LYAKEKLSVKGYLPKRFLSMDGDAKPITKEGYINVEMFYGDVRIALHQLNGKRFRKEVLSYFCRKTFMIS
jgi:excinuclease UvrABC ATPase subunit